MSISVKRLKNRLICFSLRRTRGQDAGIKVARSTFIAGFSATSNILAGKIYGIPISGTMAHSYVSAFDNERDAFFAYADTFPDHSIFLIDTYDSVEGARHAAALLFTMEVTFSLLFAVKINAFTISPSESRLSITKIHVKSCVSPLAHYCNQLVREIAFMRQSSKVGSTAFCQRRSPLPALHRIWPAGPRS